MGTILVDSLANGTLEPYLPASTDSNGESYFDGLTSLGGGRRVGVVESLERSSDRPWGIVPDLDVIPPPERWLPKSLAIFFGNYEHTGHGIHRDQHATMMFSVKGRRRIWLWPHDYISPSGRAIGTIAGHAT